MKYRDVKVKLGPHYENKFPAKLYGIIEKPKFYHIIVWLTHEQSWKVPEKEAMMADIITLFFYPAK